MKVYFAAFVLLLIAFAGMAAGLLLRRKGLRGGCHPPAGDGYSCQCKSPGSSRQLCDGEKEEAGK